MRASEKKYWLSAFAIALLVGCGGGDDGPVTSLNPETPAEGEADGDETSTVTYAEVNARVFRPRCLRCHSEAAGNVDGVNLETYRNVFARAAEIRFQVSRGHMPPDMVLPTSEKNLVINWIDAGAPQ